MRKVTTWFVLSCKRYTRRLSFLIILFLLPIGAMAAGQAEKKGGREINIAISVEGDGSNELGELLADSLTGRGLWESENMFRFYRCGDENEVRDEVASRRAECGYVIYDGLREKLDAKNFKKSIAVFAAPSTVVDALSTETVFAALMEIYNKALLQDYVVEELFKALENMPGNGGSSNPEPGSMLSRDQAAKQSGELYDKWLNNGSTFHFEYESPGFGDNQGTAAGDTVNPVFPVRGIVAVYVFITGLYAAVAVCGDEEKGLFLPLASGVRTPCVLACLASPVFMAACSGLLALWTGGILDGVLKESVFMLCYAASVSAAAWILKAVLRKSQIICCTIPFFIIGSFVFCPVFIDAGRYIRAAGQIGRLFLPWYYLNMF